MASVLDLVKHYQRSIERNPNEEQKLLRAIDKLYSLDVKVSHLQETGVGRTVNALRKEPGHVGNAARALVYKWKEMVAAEESDQEGDNPNPTSHNGHGRDQDSDSKQKSQQESQNEEKHKSDNAQRFHGKDSKDYKQINGDHSTSKRKYQSTSEEEESHAKKSRHSKSQNGDYKNKREKSKSESSDSGSQSDSQNEDSESGSSQYSEEETKVKVKIEPEDKYETKETKKSLESHPNNLKIKKEPSSSKSDSKEYYSESTKNRLDKPVEKSLKDRHSPKEKYSKDKESSHEKSYKENKHEEKKSKVESRSKHADKHDSTSQKIENSSEKHKSHDKSSSKEKHHSHSSEKDKSKSSSSKSKSSSSDKDKHKGSSSSKEKDKNRNSVEYKKSDEKLRENDKSSKHKSSSSKEKPKESSSSTKEKSSSSHKSDKKHSSEKSKSERKSDKSEDRSKKESHKSSSSSHNSKSSSSREEIPKKKVKVNEDAKDVKGGDSDDGIGCESGTSFADALGMFVPPKAKKKIKDANSPSNPFSGDLSPASLLAPSAKLTPLPAIEISALPEISPNYKPRPPPKFLPHFTDEEALSAGISTKNQRTKVYSGNKVVGRVTTLYEMCVQVLIEHIDALEYTGGVPYEILKPIVDKATPQQLYMLEHYNPYLIEDTDHLWQKFCEKSFRGKKRQEMETWREMFARCQEEQEYRLKSLTANIKMTQEAKKAPIKQTKMAYVDSVVKPPRNIARKQALHGTAHASSASPAARVAALAAAPNVLKTGAVRPPPAVSVSGSAANRPKKAPLMQKALQFMRGRKR